MTGVGSKSPPPKRPKRPVMIRITHADVMAFKRSSPLRREGKR